MAYKLIVSDMDDTLLNDERHVSDADRKALEKARACGVRFVPATGRPYTSIQGTLEEVGLNGRPGEYVISYNGGAITDNEKNDLIFFKGLDYPTASMLFEEGRERGYPMRVYTLDGNYHYRLDDDERAYLKGRLEVIPFDEEDISFLKDHKIVKVNYVSTDREALLKTLDELREKVQDLSVTFSSNRYMEFSPKGIDKGAAVLKLCEKTGIKPEEVIAVGDNFNDLSMIQAAGLGVCVQNGVGDVRREADVILKASHNEDPMEEIVENYILNLKGGARG